MRILKILAVLIVLGAIGKCLGGAGGQRAYTAQEVAREMGQRVRFPVDLGDGFRLDSIEASGKDIVSTVSLLDMPPGALPAAARAPLEAASRSDTCREINAGGGAVKQTLIHSQLRMVKRYLDAQGGVLLEVAIEPGSC